MGGAAGDMNAACVQLDEEQDIDGDQAGESPDFLGKEIGGP